MSLLHDKLIIVIDNVLRCLLLSEPTYINFAWYFGLPSWAISLDKRNSSTCLLPKSTWVIDFDSSRDVGWCHFKLCERALTSRLFQSADKWSGNISREGPDCPTRARSNSPLSFFPSIHCSRDKKLSCQRLLRASPLITLFCLPYTEVVSEGKTTPPESSSRPRPIVAKWPNHAT